MELSVERWATPWALVGVGLLLLSFLADALLSPKYAGGSGERDRGTWKLLFVTLATNLALVYGLSSLGIGRSARAAAWLGPLGCVAAVAGMALRYAAILSLGERFTWRVSIQEQHTLAQSGVFRSIRHPSYAGGLLAMLGLLATLGSWLGTLLFCLSYVPLMVHRIRVEERVLAEHFGEAWRAYQRRTARLIPFIF